MHHPKGVFFILVGEKGYILLLLLIMAFLLGDICMENYSRVKAPGMANQFY